LLDYFSFINDRTCAPNKTKKGNKAFSYLAIYSRTGVRQLSYVRRSYAIDTAPFAIHEKWRTYEWRKYECKSATYLPMSYDRHRTGHFVDYYGLQSVLYVFN